MCSNKFALYALLASMSGCVHNPRIPMPEQCSPIQNAMVCEVPPSIPFPDAGKFLCYRPEQIEPFLEKCGAR